MLGDEFSLSAGGVVKRKSDGTYAPVASDHFDGLSVALFFAQLHHPKCATVMPVLKQFYLKTNEGYAPPSIEVVYVSLDENEEMYDKARATMPWCSVEYNSDLRKFLIERYRVADRTIKFGRGARIPSDSLPQIIIVGPHGEQAGKLDLMRGSPENFLLNWDYRYNKWPGKTRLPSSVATW